MAEIDLTAAIEAGQARIAREYEERVGFAARRTDRGQELLAVAETAIRAAAPLIERAARERVIAELRYADRLNERLWQGNTASRDPSYQIAADWLAGNHLQATATDPSASVGMMAGQVARDVAEFHAMIGAPPWTGPIADMPATSVGVRNGLIREEVRELVHATLCHDMVGIADALADVVYVAYGTAYTYGIDLDAVLMEVHRANMSKDPGPTGKAVKGPRYRAPDVAAVLADGAT